MVWLGHERECGQCSPPDGRAGTNTGGTSRWANARNASGCHLRRKTRSRPGVSWSGPGGQSPLRTVGAVVASKAILTNFRWSLGGNTEMGVSFTGSHDMNFHLSDLIEGDVFSWRFEHHIVIAIVRSDRTVVSRRMSDRRLFNWYLDEKIFKH